MSAAASTSVTRVDIHDDIAVMTFNRPEKRNAMNDALVTDLDAFFTKPPEGIRAVILTGAGGHFCSGLDLSEHHHRTPKTSYITRATGTGSLI